MSDGGHPLPASEEARHHEIPEHLEREKGKGDDAPEPVQATEPVEPNGDHYAAGDLGRGPGTSGE